MGALAESANMDDTSIPLSKEIGEADEQIGESRGGTAENKSWGFRKVVWIGGAVFVGTVIAALVFKWSSAAKSPDPHSVTQLTQTGVIPLDSITPITECNDVMFGFRPDMQVTWSIKSREVSSTNCRLPFLKRSRLQHCVA